MSNSNNNNYYNMMSGSGFRQEMNKDCIPGTQGFGLVDIANSQPMRNYPLFEEKTDPYCFSNSLKSIQDDTPLSRAFFSSSNVDYLQKKIQDEVFIRSSRSGQMGYRIGRQSDLQLHLIMRSIYLQNSMNLNCNIDRQLNELNQKVIDDPNVINGIIVNIEQQKHYQQTSSNLPCVMNHPENMSNAGQNTLYDAIGFADEEPIPEWIPDY